MEVVGERAACSGDTDHHLGARFLTKQQAHWSSALKLRLAARHSLTFFFYPAPFPFSRQPRAPEKQIPEFRHRLLCGKVTDK